MIFSRTAVRLRGVSVFGRTSVSFDKARACVDGLRPSFQVLHFSSDDFSEERVEPTSLVQRLKPQLMNIAMVGGAGITAFGGSVM